MVTCREVQKHEKKEYGLHTQSRFHPSKIFSFGIKPSADPAQWHRMLDAVLSSWGLPSVSELVLVLSLLSLSSTDNSTWSRLLLRIIRRPPSFPRIHRRWRCVPLSSVRRPDRVCGWEISHLNYSVLQINSSTQGPAALPLWPPRPLLKKEKTPSHICVRRLTAMRLAHVYSSACSGGSVALAWHCCSFLEFWCSIFKYVTGACLCAIVLTRWTLFLVSLFLFSQW